MADMDLQANTDESLESKSPQDAQGQARIRPALFAVAEADGERARKLNVPAGIVRFSASGSEFVLDADGCRITPDTAYLDLVGFVVLSSSGREAADAFRDYWSETFGEAPPETLDLSAAAAGEVDDALLRWMVGRISASRAQAAERNVTLMRDLSVLRQSHEMTQSAFQRLEAMFQSMFHAKRALDINLKDNPEQPVRALDDGERLTQRLPCDSVGLCDISVFVAGRPADETGRLHARLTLSESGEQVAEWVIDGSEIHPGWLRLSLETALSVDPQTPVLELEWTGQAPLTLASSFPHPDSRFQPRPDAPVLALQVWRFVPDTAAAFPADGHICHNTGHIRRWSIGKSYQTTAESLARPRDLIDYDTALGGLLVRPRGRAVSAARLTRAGRVGVTQIMASVETKQAEGPRVQYAIGVAQSGARPWFGRAVPRFKPGMATEWYELGPSEWAQLHLFLPQAIEEVSDIYLMTRLAPGQRASEPAAACFFQITGSVQ